MSTGLALDDLEKMAHLLEQMAPEVEKPKPPNRVDLLNHGFTLSLRKRNASTSFKDDLTPPQGVSHVHDNLIRPIPTIVDSGSRYNY